MMVVLATALVVMMLASILPSFALARTPQQQTRVRKGYCSPGEYYVDSSSSRCENCPLGKFNTLGALRGTDASSYINLRSCETCVEGTMASRPGSSACERCAAGRHSVDATSVRGQCVSCEPGSAQGRVGRGSCILCKWGRYSSAAGAAACSMCQPGQYQGREGASSCRDCPPGTYTPPGDSGTGRPICTKCRPGEYQGRNSYYRYPVRY